MESCLGVNISTLYFPDMQYLLAWSRSPKLPEHGVTLISGSERVISVLRGVINSRHVMLTSSKNSLSHIKAELHLRLINSDVTEAYNEYIRFTSLEMEYMWNYIRGAKPESKSDEKRNSRLRRRVMEKIGADNIVSLIIRFRLLFALDEKFLQKHVKMRNYIPSGKSDSSNMFTKDIVPMGKIVPGQSDELNFIYR